MMRGWTPLFVSLGLPVAALLAGAPAHAQERNPDEPMPACCTPPPPTLACCAERSTDAGRALLLKLSVGPTYRDAYGEDFFAVMPELEIGGQTRRYSIGARVSAALGATRIGLPYQSVSLGPAFMSRVSPRVMIGFGQTFGFLLYERATTGGVVWSPSLGATFGGTIDVARTRGGGAVYLEGRVAVDCILALKSGVDWSVAPNVALGWRL